MEVSYHYLVGLFMFGIANFVAPEWWKCSCSDLGSIPTNAV